MNRKQLIVDLIIVIVAFVGIFVYLHSNDVGSATKSTTDTTTLTTLATTTMPETENASGLKIETTKEGTGEVTKNGDAISVNYTGKLTNGTVFDSSIPRGEPFTLTLGRGQVIKGWDLGLLNMKVGEERRLTIPSSLAYGKDGFPGVIPPDATLIFEVSLVTIK